MAMTYLPRQPPSRSQSQPTVLLGLTWRLRGAFFFLLHLSALLSRLSSLRSTILSSSPPPPPPPHPPPPPSPPPPPLFTITNKPFLRLSSHPLRAFRPPSPPLPQPLRQSTPKPSPPYSLWASPTKPFYRPPAQNSHTPPPPSPPARAPVQQPPILFSSSLLASACRNHAANHFDSVSQPLLIVSPWHGRIVKPGSKSASSSPGPRARPSPALLL
ncbi:hypothetical protein XA68_14444 [Ophiocordyceps unilateralis]|uniref:Uncharacterized protein n=1 Tax=Ophiocordyceps unilateralis TaxID=268505 RepID=A0A2A9PAE7_OPHUN|nr:hypothetical protein XA68_14444 [Ophiocordyceps unilateralis]